MTDLNEKCKVCGFSFGDHRASDNACPVGLGSFGWPFPKGEPAHLESPVAPTPTASLKPTNPKDACGVRKAPMSTVPASVLAEVGVAMLEGALKYGRHNYREVGVRASVYYDGTLRHMLAWWEGEDIDADSNLSHITKAIASLTVLRDTMMRGMVEDDRPPKTPGMYAELNKRAAELTDRYAGREVRHITEQNKETK